MTKQEILKAVIEQMRTWIEFYEEVLSGDDSTKKIECYRRCSTLQGLLLSMNIINIEKSKLLDAIIHKMIYGYVF